MTDREERLARWATACAVTALVGWAAYHRYRLLGSSPHPIGIDGYYYPIQLRSLLDGGALAYPSSPLALWAMLPFAAVTDPITGAKLGAALGTALIAAPVYLIGRRLGGGRAVGVLASVLAVTSAESFFLATEFVKNGVALTVMAGYLAALLWALDRPSRARVVTAAALLVATALAHKTAFAFAAIATVPPVWARAGSRARRVALVAAGVVAAIAVAGLVAPARFLAVRDLALIGDLFTADANWSLPVLDRRFDPLLFRHEVAIAGALGVAALLIAALTEREGRAAALGPALVAVLAALPWIDASDHQGLGFRVRLLSFVPLALCGAFVAGYLLQLGASLWRRLIPERPELAAAVVALGFAFGIFVALPATSETGIVRAHPAMLAAVRAVDVPDDGVVIVPERHIMYMVTWYTGAPARLRPESVPPERRWRLLPGAHLDSAIRDAIDRARREPVPGARPRALHSGDRNGLVLVDEATWQWIVAQLPEPSKSRYEAWPTI